MNLKTAVIGLALALTGCMGIDTSTIRSAGADASQTKEGRSVVTGRIKHVVDGAELAYGLLDRPTLLLFSRADGRYLATPIVQRDGAFSWELPPGDYGVAVIFGGVAPPSQPHRMANGHFAFVNGLVDPGVEFVATPNASTYLGTLIVDVKSKPAEALLGGRVFASLNGISVEHEQKERSSERLFRVID